MFLAIIAIILTLLLVVGIHEAGHALVARYFQVKIKKISIGFGKPLLRWQTSSGCEWVWAMFPLGGYVQLENTRISPVEPSEYSGCFDKKPIWQRILILLAGAVANLITAWIALILVYSIGLTYTLPQVKSVQPNSLAAQAGITVGDQFVSIADRATPTWNDVGMQMVVLWGQKEVPMVLSHGTELKKVTINLSQVSFRGAKSHLLSQLGIEPNLSAPRDTLRSSSLGAAIHQANAVIGNMLYFFVMIFKQLFTGVIPFSMLLGPLSVFAASVASLTQGIVVFMFFIATLSLAVALVNLFPIPGLDGGSIVYAILEKIRGKSISVAMELLVHRLVFIVFCVVLVHLLMNDLQRI
ncbi:M50 family metallopeptidase [Legionella saoudiensis]|uniref:M50 family metallopeptidase n=1 Tax=Legionella saoudiensis TaxID=1750561 RepID=UPI000731A4DA|nr:site-2 protease family protein [Legionella saoudiensis]